jgi:hypothetical protein
MENSCTTDVIPGSVGNLRVEFFNNLAPYKRGKELETFLLEKPLSTDVVLFYLLFPRKLRSV